MNYQNTNKVFGFSFKNISSIVSLYFYTLGTLILGFSAYLLISTINGTNQLTNWSGQSLFWTLIIFFAAIFILFLPVEFFNSIQLSNSSFNDLIANVIMVISFSLFFLLLFQAGLGNNNTILTELKAITRSVSFSGFIVVPFALFVLQNFSNRFQITKKYSFSIVLIIWIISSQFFL